MAATADETVLIRQVQGLAVLLSSLPAGGKARELFTMALGVDHSPVLSKLGPPDDPDSDDGLRTWLESHWGDEAVSEEEKKLVDWQADSENMSAAIDEFRSVAAKLGSA